MFANNMPDQILKSILIFLRTATDSMYMDDVVDSVPLVEVTFTLHRNVTDPFSGVGVHIPAGAAMIPLYLKTSVIGPNW